MKITVPLMMSDVKNKNGRVYSYEVLKDSVEQFKVLKEKSMPMFGELGMGGEITDLSHVSHEITDVWLQNTDSSKEELEELREDIEKNFGEGSFEAVLESMPKILMGNIKIVDSKIDETLLDSCCFRSRGIGNVDADGYVHDYKLISFDMVPKSEDSYEGLI